MCRISDKRAKEILEDLNKHEVIMFENTDDEAESEYTNIELHQALEAGIESLKYDDEQVKFLKNSLDYVNNKLESKTKWVIDEYGDYHCEKCNAIIEKDEWGRHNYNYCYHCGARMEVEDEI
jgi:hypothetical protein